MRRENRFCWRNEKGVGNSGIQEFEEVEEEGVAWRRFVFLIGPMSIEQPDVVDIIGTDRMSGKVVLTISDHLDWSDSVAHQLLLQAKLNRYVAFVESGEILESYPSAKDKSVVFAMVFRFLPDEGGRAFLAKIRPIIESAGFSLREEVWRGGPFN